MNGLKIASLAMAMMVALPSYAAATHHHHHHHHLHHHPAHLAHTAPRAAHLVKAEHVEPPLPSFEAANMPRLNAQSVLVVDASDGKPILQKNPDMETPIASISKLMTAMVVLDAHPDLNEKMSISEDDVDHVRHTRSRLAVGTELTRNQMMHLALISSENRAAFALSRYYPGGRPAFINAMNRKAAELGMTHTRFEDPTGLSSHNQSTAEDLAKMVAAAAKYPLIHEITTTGHYEIAHTALVRVRHPRAHEAKWAEVTREMPYLNTNVLVREGKWDIGLSKTGFINEAGHCLVMKAKIASHSVIIVLLDAVGKMDRINDAQRIRQWMEAHGGEVSKVASR